jgi:hypothetical protein
MLAQGYVLYLSFIYLFLSSFQDIEGGRKEAGSTKSMAVIIRKGWLSVGKKEAKSMTTRPWTQKVSQQGNTKEVRAK